MALDVRSGNAGAGRRERRRRLVSRMRTRRASPPPATSTSLFLNNDVEPFERGWLRELRRRPRARRACADRSDAAARASDTSAAAADGTLVQHRGIRLRRGADGVLPYNDGDGERPLRRRVRCRAGGCRPSATPACSCERATFERLGGFSRRYRYGLEDVDLGMRATAAGLAVAVSGRADPLPPRVRPRAPRRGPTSCAPRATPTGASWLERWGPRCAARTALATAGARLRLDRRRRAARRDHGDEPRRGRRLGRLVHRPRARRGAGAARLACQLHRRARRRLAAAAGRPRLRARAARPLRRAARFRPTCR